MTKPAIAVENLKYRYASVPNDVLNIAELKVPEMKSFFLAGPSGSGKTTLLGVLSGILSGYQGKVEIMGYDLAKFNASQRDRFRGEMIGYIFQMFNLIFYLNVEENIALPCMLNKGRQQHLKKSLKEEIQTIAGDLEIGGFLKKPVLELSVGQQQRVAAARALLGSPKIIIADEPTSALDSHLRQKFIELLMSQAKKNKQTIFFVSHDPLLQNLFDTAISLPKINKAQ